MLQVGGMLQHQSSKASEYYAKESRKSAARMEKMTLTMQDLAVKTTQETVSMRVITTVTLFFLPATFIAVSHRSTVQGNGALTDDTSDFHEHKHSQVREWRTGPTN